MSRIYLMSLLFLCPGCGGMFRSAMELAEFTKAADQAVIAATPEQAIAAIQAELPLEDLVANAPRTEGGRTVVFGAPAAASGLEKALTSGMKALGSTDDYGDLPRGCTVTIFPVGEAISLRAECFEVVEDQPMGGKGRPITRRQTWQDPYLVTRIIEHLNPAAAERLWTLETTGHRLRRCALGPEMLNFGCPPKRKPRKAAPPG